MVCPGYKTCHRLRQMATLGVAGFVMAVGAGRTHDLPALLPEEWLHRDPADS
jgi:hypothetical protein